MGRKCSVSGCSSNSRQPQHQGVTYHSFPLDLTIRSIWLRNTRMSADRQITKSVLVCSRHFRRADFQPQRSGKYLLKQRVFPTVFPWGRVDSEQIESDLQELRKSTPISPQTTLAATIPINAERPDEATKATVEATVAQIMAETAELNAAAVSSSSNVDDTTISSPNVKFEAVKNFNLGARLEAQDFDGVWHGARIVEIDNDDREVLIKFEKVGKNKSNIAGTEEWIPMNSSRLRQKVSTKQLQTFEVDEKCLARWSGPPKFPATVKNILGNDCYEVLFDDGFIKNVRASNIFKLKTSSSSSSSSSSKTIDANSTAAVANEIAGIISTPTQLADIGASAVKSPLNKEDKKQRTIIGQRKDWPLLDLSKLDLESLNLPVIPQDGEWTCHWVNDQPIGKEGFLVVGEHRKPTVIVDDWRLPTGWIKHMYQRSNVLGKWDVILVSPSGKRFRSKADLKNFLEELGQVYNPDIYDFSIHRRRAKDINAYAFTPDYTPQPPIKPKALESTLSPSPRDSPKLIQNASLFSPKTPLMSPKPIAQITETTDVLATGPLLSNTETTTDGLSQLPTEDGYVLIGGLKVQIIDNLFRCPQEGCLKNFRKENHLQIHVKHYHQDLIKLMNSSPPKMLELAEKQTYKISQNPNEPQPKNQISNQEFFAKLHQQDILQHSRGSRKSTQMSSVSPEVEIKTEIKNETLETEPEKIAANEAGAQQFNNSNIIEDNNLNLTSLLPTAVSSPINNTAIASPVLSNASSEQCSTHKQARFSPNKRPSGSRRSNRQRTTRRYLTTKQASKMLSTSTSAISDNSNVFAGTDFEETRQSFNSTPNNKMHESRKRRLPPTPATPLGADALITADSNSQHTSTPIELDNFASPSPAISLPNLQPQYIKENGELIKIVRMRQEEIINCLCGYGEEDGLMIQCELCLCWQHGSCNGITKESQVPEKYVCYICRNPHRERESMRYKHDQDWLYDGKLPSANFHTQNPNLQKRNDYLKKSHELTGNLLELNRFLNSLNVKINIANNRCHPKLYLWAKKWDSDVDLEAIKNEIKTEENIKTEDNDCVEMKLESPTAAKRIKIEPNVPQPEAAIDPAECQQRLLEHIKVQQDLVMQRLNNIESEINELEGRDEMFDMKYDDNADVKDVLSSYVKELEVLQRLGKLNLMEFVKNNKKTN